MVFTERDFIFKVILIGDVRVGKTSLRRRFMGKSFLRNYLATLGADFSHTTIKYDDTAIRYSIWDLAGSRTFERIHPQYFHNALGVIIVYDLTIPPSLVNVNFWLHKVIEINPEFNSVIAIVGNKSDLIPPESLPSKEAELDNFIEQLHVKYDNKFHVISALTSALNGNGVNVLFRTLGKKLIEWAETMVESDSDTAEDFVEEIFFVSHSNETNTRIIAASPYNDTDVFVNGKMKDIKAFSKLFDFSSSQAYHNFFSITPWNSKDAVAYSLTRNLDEKLASNSNEFAFISLVIKLQRVISSEEVNYLSEQLSLIFDQVERVLRTYRANFNTTEFNPMVRYKSARLEITKILNQAKSNISYHFESNG